MIGWVIDVTSCNVVCKLYNRVCVKGLDIEIFLIRAACYLHAGRVRSYSVSRQRVHEGVC